MIRALFIIIFFLAACVSVPPTTTLGDFVSKFEHNETSYTVIVTEHGKPATGLNMQGQIMNSRQEDIFYAQPSEVRPGVYTLDWKPSEAGQYFVQFVFKGDNTTLKPTFPIEIKSSQTAYNGEKAIHWHSQLNISICGKPYHLPLETGDLNKQHTHAQQGKLHAHIMMKMSETGEVLEPEKLKLGHLFEQFAIPFNETCIAEHCNGNPCEGKQGKLRMTVNGKDSLEFANYSWSDNDEIRIYFE